MTSEDRRRLQLYLRDYPARQQQREARRLELKLQSALQDLPARAPVRYREIRSERVAPTFETPRTHHTYTKISGVNA